MKKLEDVEQVKYDFMLSSLGYTDEPLDQRAIVLCKILKELNIPYKKYYTSPKYRHLRTLPNNDFNEINMIISAVCDENYASYAIYLFEKKMEQISKLNNML